MIIIWSSKNHPMSILIWIEVDQIFCNQSGFPICAKAKQPGRWYRKLSFQCLLAVRKKSSLLSAFLSNFLALVCGIDKKDQSLLKNISILIFLVASRILLANFGNLPTFFFWIKRWKYQKLLLPISSFLFVKKIGQNLICLDISTALFPTPWFHFSANQLVSTFKIPPFKTQNSVRGVLKKKRPVFVVFDYEAKQNKLDFLFSV